MQYHRGVMDLIRCKVDKESNGFKKEESIYK